MTIFTEVGAYEAKTHLSDFLRKVKAGAVIRITQRGEHVADLVPPEPKDKRDAANAASRMEKFMRSHAPIANVDTKALIDEGRD
jgi:prevent-host-death family protein